jgi:Xaa-Pro dipeptidase
MWCGESPSLEDYKKGTGADEVVYTNQLVKLLKEWQPTQVFTLKESLPEIEKAIKESELKEVKFDTDRLYAELRECRLRKTQDEIEILQRVNKVASEAHKKLMEMVKPGMYEYEIEAAFQYYCASKGCRYLAYPSIVAGGDRGATLHYVNNDKELEDGGLILVDAGAEDKTGYASDITRTFPVNGKFTKQQREIYEIVLKAQKEVIASAKVGVSWVDMHKLATKIITQGLLDLGILKGSLEDCIQHNVGAIFFPHGLGHSLGLDVHDPPNRDGSFSVPDEAGIKYLRCAPILEEGICLTVEPGIYFIKGIINESLKDENLAKFVNQEKLKEYMNFGGVRIEDDIIVTKDGVLNLTDCPKEIDEIEAIMAGKK